MTAIKIGETVTFSVDDVRTVTVDFSDVLEDGELLTGTPTVSQPTNTTISNIAITTAIFLDKTGFEIPIGEAFQFQFTSDTALADPGYALSISVGTDATNAQTIKGTIYVIVQ